MEVVPKRILDFVGKHHVFTLSSSSKNIPYSCSCFYIFQKETPCFIFTSDETTRHGQELLSNKTTAGNIVLETETIGKIQGIQFTGTTKQIIDKKEFKVARKIYLKRFPYAVFSIKELWSFEVEFIKMTDNLLGFGKKIIWNKKTIQ
jgi:uncharacterized protein